MFRLRTLLRTGGGGRASVLIGDGGILLVLGTTVGSEGGGNPRNRSSLSPIDNFGKISILCRGMKGWIQGKYGLDMILSLEM